MLGIFLFLKYYIMKHIINNQKTVFNDHYKTLKAEVKYDTFAGTSIETTRFAFHRGNSVAILLHDIDSNSILLTKQFRYPTTLQDDGWILELPAGSMDENECPLTCVKRETLEEMGYQINQPQQIFSFYTSPGGATEKLYLFFDTVKSQQKIEKGDGLATENEDIKTVKIPVNDIKEWLKNKIMDAKTIIALQWFLMKNDL